MEDRLRVLVVDQTAIWRKILRGVLAPMPIVEVVGVVSTAKVAIATAQRHCPDLLILGLELPDMEGMEVLRRLRTTDSTTGVIILSSGSDQSADVTMAALDLGAFDFVVKPKLDAEEQVEQRLRHELGRKIEAFATAKYTRRILAGVARGPSASHTVTATSPRTGANEIAQRMARIARVHQAKPLVVALGVSTGGPRALAKTLPQLPSGLSVPLLIVQHMPRKFTRLLADSLNGLCGLTVSEAEDGQPVEAGRVLIAPGGRHMRIQKMAGEMCVQITDDPPENSCRPSVNYLFRSVAQHYGAEALAVLMTGMGGDGAAGCRAMKQRGATILAQDEATCVVYGMPRAPVEEGLADVIAPLDCIASEIVRLVR